MVNAGGSSALPDDKDAMDASSQLGEQPEADMPFDERARDAPGSTGRGPAFASTSVSMIIPTMSPVSVRQSWTAPSLLPNRRASDPHEELLRANEAEIQAQRTMIEAQRETLRAGDQVIDALRRQVRTLQARLDETSSINAALIRSQRQILDGRIDRAMRERAAIMARSQRSAVARNTSDTTIIGDYSLSHTYMPLDSTSRLLQPDDMPNDQIDQAEEDIYADMPPLEGFPDPEPLPTLPANVSAAIDWASASRAPLPPPDQPFRHRRRNSALESLRTDAAFRARLQQIMPPENAARVLRVLDRSFGPDQVEEPAIEVPSSQTVEQIPGSPRSDARARWELAKGLVDGNGDFVEPKKRHLGTYHVGR